MYDPTINGFSSPNRDWKSKSGVFSSAGRSIAVHDDAIQHNFSYKPSKEIFKKEADQVEYERLRQFQNEADLAGLAKVNPTAYGNYVNNLEKMNNNLMKVDAYAEEFNRAKEKLHYDQRNLDSLQKLSKFNADQHKQHIQNQLQRMREPATDRKFAALRDNPQRKQQQSRGNLAHFTDKDYETQNNLLSQFANSNSLDDHLSGFGNDQSRNYGQNLRNNSGNSTPLAQHKQSPYNPPPPQFNVQSSPQFNPYPAPGYGYPPYNPYMPPPNYGYGYPPYQPPQNNENSEMKYQMQRQNDLLEALTKRIAPSRERGDSRHRRNLSSRALEDKFKDYEKETELRLQLMKQQQLIENLQANNNQPNQSADVYNPQTLAQNFMQHLNPFQYGYDAFSNPYYTPQYNPLYNNGYGYPGYDPYSAFGHSPYKSKKHKSSSKYKKKKASSSDSEDSDNDSDASDNDDGKKRKSQSSKKDPKVRRPQNKRKTRVDRKKDAKSHLKKILWCMVYPTIFDKYVSKKVVHRKQIQQRHVDEQFEAFTQNFTTWIMNITQEGFTKLVDDAKKNYDFIGLDFKKLSKSDITKRATDCKAKIKILFETLLNKTDQYALEPTNLEFLASLCYKPAYIANHTISNFELMRLQFNYFGRVDKQTQEQAEMMISCFLLVRILAYQIIYKASEWNQKPKWTEQLLTNFKIVASLIYHLIKSIWEQEIPIINQNPSKLPNTRISPLLMDPGLEVPQGPSDDPDMILGALNKTQLASVLEEDKQWVDSMKQLVRDWTAKIYKMLGDYRLKTAAKDLDQEPSLQPLAASVGSINISATRH